MTLFLCHYNLERNLFTEAVVVSFKVLGILINNFIFIIITTEDLATLAFASGFI